VVWQRQGRGCPPGTAHPPAHASLPLSRAPCSYVPVALLRKVPAFRSCRENTPDPEAARNVRCALKRAEKIKRRAGSSTVVALLRHQTLIC
jgi:hypothetical protein